METYSAEEVTPERAGRIPSAFLIDLFSNKNLTQEEIGRILKKDVGLYGHLGTSSCIEIEQRIREGDKKAAMVYEAMAYQVSKDISSLGAVVYGKVDAVILTGGIAHSKMFTGWIKERWVSRAGDYHVGLWKWALAGGVTGCSAGRSR